MAKIIQCADCGKELHTWHAQAFHTCPQQRRANKLAQAKRNQDYVEQRVRELMREQKQDTLDAVADELAKSPMPPR